MDDHELASHLAKKAGSELLKLRDDGIASGINSWVLRDKADIFAGFKVAIQFIIDDKTLELFLAPKAR